MVIIILVILIIIMVRIIIIIVVVVAKTRPDERDQAHHNSTKYQHRLTIALEIDGWMDSSIDR